MERILARSSTGKVEPRARVVIYANAELVDLLPHVQIMYVDIGSSRASHELR